MHRLAMESCPAIVNRPTRGTAVYIGIGTVVVIVIIVLVVLALRR